MGSAYPISTTNYATAPPPMLGYAYKSVSTSVSQPVVMSELPVGVSEHPVAILEQPLSEGSGNQTFNQSIHILNDQ